MTTIEIDERDAQPSAGIREPERHSASARSA